MYTRILTPLDGSRLSEGVLPYVRTFARAFRCPVELLEVVEPDAIKEALGPQRGRDLDVAEMSMRKASTAYLEQIARSFPDPAAVTLSVDVGRVPEVIAKKAAAHPGSLIAMSTHGRSPLPRWALGGVTDRVVRTSGRPVLVVRPPAGAARAEEAAELRAVILPLDGSPLAEGAREHAVNCCTALGAELLLVRVVKPIALYASEGVAATLTYDPMVDLEGEAEAYLERQEASLRGGSLKEVRHRVLIGDPAQQIVRLAEKTEGSLVVMSTHGRSGLARWAVGSVTEKVVRHSGRPVLVVRAPEMST